MSKNYRDFYSIQDVMSKKLCFSAITLMFNPVALISSLNAPKNDPILLSDFSEEQLSEIEKYANSYTEKPYVIEVKERIYVVIPSMYPSTTSCLLLRIDMKPNVFLRFVKEKADFFVLSKGITVAPARMSKRLDNEKKKFLDLCFDIERIFMYFDRFSLSFDDDEIVDGYYDQVILLSKFLAVPLENINIKRSDDGVPIKSNFALFTAFCTTIMMLAKNEADDRKISIELEFFGGSVIVNVSFNTKNRIRITQETFLWEYIAANKKMFFEYRDGEDKFYITFHPVHIDWAYLDMKQEPNVDMDFEFNDK